MRKVEPTKSGSYRVRFRLNGKQTSETFDTHSEAAEFAIALHNYKAVKALAWLDDKHAERKTIPTLNQIAADHIESLTHVEPGTRHRYTGIWSRTWGSALGDKPVTDVTIDDLRAVVGVLAQTYSEKSMKNARGLLHAVLDRAVAEGHVPVNIAKRRLKLPTGGGHDREDMRILTIDEFSTLEAALPEHYRPFVRFLWGTGCRWGEAVALTVGDVRLPNVMIRRAQKYAPGEYRIGAPKTKRGRRTIAIPAELHAELEALCKGKAPGDLVFTAPMGGAVRHRTFWDRYWRPAAEQVLEPRPRIHDLRHSHASHLLGRGVPIHVVQARLGHESIKTTVDTYSHLLPDAQRLAADAAALAFKPPPELD